MPTNEQAETTSQLIAVVLLVVGWVVAWLIWPTGVMDMPLASVTVLAFLRMLGAGVVVLFTLYGAAMLWF